MLRSFLEEVVHVIRRGLAWVSARLMPRRRAFGIEMVDFTATEQSDDYFDRLTSALAVVEKYDPTRLERIRRDLGRIGTVRGGGELYDHGLRTYFATGPLVLQRSPERNALAIVHEATHARLRRRGIVTTRENQERIERLCVAQEVSFAARLPDPETLSSEAMGKLSTPWWSESDMGRRHEEQMRGFGVPEWLIRLRRWRSQ
jgi:hypothetical protein